MKQNSKKIILLISTILSLIVSIYYIVAISAGIIELSVIGDVTQISNTTQISILVICSIVNILSLVFISKDIIKHKKKIIWLNIIQLLLGTMINIISAIINIIIVSSFEKSIKTKDKKQLPNLENISKYKWYVYLTIFILLFTICYTPIINLIPIPNTKIMAIVTIALLYIIQIIFLTVPMYNELKRDFTVFKNNFKLYMSDMLPRFGVIIIVYLFSNVSVLIWAGNIPNNQQTLINMPLYITALLAIIVAPLTEELMFRGFIKKFIKNDIIFIIISSLIFGGLHVVSANSIQQFLYIIPYSILGFAFSLNYVKTRNIASNIFLHCMWNTLAIIVVILAAI